MAKLTKKDDKDPQQQREDERRERTPLDYRRQEQDHFLKEYGSFLALWCSFDLTLEIAIMRELRLNPQEASIVCAGNAFGSKVNILYSLLARDDANADKIKAVREAQNFAERNTFVHGFIFRDDYLEKFSLVRREVKDKYRARSKDLHSTDMTEHALTFGRLFHGAMNALGVSEKDLDDYAQSIRSDVTGQKALALRRRKFPTSSRRANRK